MITIPGYQIRKNIYESVNSLVYQARRDSDDQPVIIKVLKGEYPSPQELVRYRQEYDMTSTLEVEGVIRSYSLEHYQNTFAIIFEDFGADSLTILRDSGKLSLHAEPLESFLKIAIQIVGILGGIHDANVIHKDINPSNIVLNPATGQLKIIGFGIATVLTRENPVFKNPRVLEGTLAYISPEQTGRMNRNLDYRTDFYSLGVTFYELLTGRLPFETDDSLELVHYHIAKQPVPPCEVFSPPPNLPHQGGGTEPTPAPSQEGNSPPLVGGDGGGGKQSIPKPVSDIIMKLLAKNAEDRYQSAYGVKADLEYCLVNLQGLGDLEGFMLGKHDVSGRFHIPQKLYGRESEITTLLQTFERVSSGATELMLVTGYAGVGKTVLVHEVHKPMTEKRGYFIAGKFDQFHRNVPYSAITQAFHQFCEYVLTEPADQLAAWQQRIEDAVGNNGQVLIDIIPDLERIIGTQPPVPQVGPQDVRNRFNLYFQAFIQAISQPEHPLVLFLDDLQWVDTASLNLLKLILTDTQNQYLLVIGTYRDNKVTAGHPLLLTINEIEKAETTISRIQVQNLSQNDVSALIADSLSCDAGFSQPLTNLVYAKTYGNAFFVNQFLQSLYEGELLTFDVDRRMWTWDVEHIQAREITDNVVDLMAGKISKLALATQHVLKLAACGGNTFDLKTLAIISENPPGKTLEHVLEGVAEGLIYPLDNRYKLVTVVAESDTEETMFTFVHDRVQQAAYSLIEPEQRKDIHVSIGRLLLANTPDEVLEENIFDIVNQLNQGTALISEKPEKLTLAGLNLLAGRKSKAAMAYDPALRYLESGLDLLPESAWQDRYDLTLALYVEATETAFLNGNFEKMEHAVEAVLQHAHTLPDKVKVYEVKIQAYIAQNRRADAVRYGLHVLKLFHVEFPENPDKSDFMRGLQETQALLAEKSTEDIIALPEMKEPIQRAAMRILGSMISCTYTVVPMLVPLIVFKHIKVSVTYGNTPQPPFMYGIYGFILSGRLGNIESGYRFGQLALDLVNRLNAIESKARTIHVVNLFIRHWKEHCRETLHHFQEAYQVGLETGDLEFAGHAALGYCRRAYITGQELNELEHTMTEYSDACKRFNQETSRDWIKLLHQAVLNLLGRADSSADSPPCRLIGESYDERVMIPFYQQEMNKTMMYYIFINKLILSYLFQDFDQAVKSAEAAEQYLDGAAGIDIFPLFHYYDSLAKLAVYPDVPALEQEQILNKVAANQGKLENWAQHAPMNYRHKFYLVEAERAQVLNKDGNAREYYDKAIDGARENGYLNDEALAYELAGKFYLAKGRDRLAEVYLHDAHYAYQRWGALAKVKDLEQRYPELLKGPLEGQKKRPTSKKGPAGLTAQALDIQTILKASHTLSGEIVLHKLLEKMMRVVIENAGAEKGFLLLPGRDTWCIEAEGYVNRAEVRVLQSTPHRHQLKHF